MSQWIAVDCDLGTHPKFRRLQATLGEPEPARLVGGLVMFWAAVRKHAPDGHLVGWEAGDVAAAMGWPLERAAELVKAMITARLLDTDGDGSWTVHAWDGWQGKWLRDAERKRAERSRGSKLHPRTVRGQSEDHPRTVGATDPSRAERTRPNGQDRTEPSGQASTPDSTLLSVGTPACAPRKKHAARPPRAGPLPIRDGLIAELEARYPQRDVKLIAAKLQETAREYPAKYRSLSRALLNWVQAAEARDTERRNGPTSSRTAKPGFMSPGDIAAFARTLRPKEPAL